MDFSGDGIPRISLELVGDAMGDIQAENRIYHSKPVNRMVVNNTEAVVSECALNAKICAFLVVYYRNPRNHATWDLATNQNHQDPSNIKS